MPTFYQPPFHELEAEQYLDEQIAYMLPKWIEEATSGRDSDGGYFPAVDVSSPTVPLGERSDAEILPKGGRLPEFLAAGNEAWGG